MATTMRSVDTRFWVDGWVRKLNALDRYVFLYFLTNTHSTWCGVYEVDLGMVAFETGIDEKELLNAILPRLSPKIIYVDGWVVIRNFEKYHSNHSEKTKKGIENAWKLVPEDIKKKIETYPIEGVSASASASASASISDADASANNKSENMFGAKSDDFLEGEVNYDEDATLVPEKKPQTRKYPNAPAVRKLFQEILGRNPAAWRQNKNQLLACENLFEERGLESVRKALEFYKEHQGKEYCPKIHSPHCLDSKWTKLGEYKLRV